MMTWTTRTEAVGAVRAQMQDTGATPRYTDAELGRALDEAIADLGMARPIVVLIHATLDATRVLRLDDKIGATTFGSLSRVIDMTDPGKLVPVYDWQYGEQAGQHKVALPMLAAGTKLAVTVRCGYGFALASPELGTLDTNIPAAWRDALLVGAQGYALDLYGAREVGRANVAPAMAQQTARAANVKLRAFHQWLFGLPVTDNQRHEATWGLEAADRGGY